MIFGLAKSHHLKKEMFCLKMLQYNSRMWKNKCNDNYKQYRLMVDNQEFFLWKQYGIRTVLTDRKEVQMKINNLGKIFHNPHQKYHLQHNGQILISPSYAKDFIKIGKSILNEKESRGIEFPGVDENNHSTYCYGDLENINYLQELMHSLKIFKRNRARL